MIPKKVHYVWFGGGEMNATLKRCLESWKKYLPDYELKLWNEDNAPNYPYLKEMVKFKKWALISDYLRLYSLYHEGGIYLDTDVEVVKSFDGLLLDKCFIGFQEERASSHWINCAVMGAEEGHPFIKDCLKLFNNSHKSDLKPLVGPHISTFILRKYGLRNYGNQEINGVKVFKTEYFYPYHCSEKFTPSCIKEDTHCIHHWQISWLNRKTLKDRYASAAYKISRAGNILRSKISNPALEN